jgi:hypothetical protein
MSAQQRDARSRGQMSTTTGSPAASAPYPDSWPSADWPPWATITSPGRSQSCSSQTAIIAARISSDVRPGRSSRISVAATPIAASAAFCARRMPSSCAGVFCRRRSTNASLSTSSVTPLARRWSATASGKSGGTIARSSPSSRHARSVTSSATSWRGRPAASSASAPSVAGSRMSMPSAATLSASSTPTVAARRPPTSA